MLYLVFSGLYYKHFLKKSCERVSTYLNRLRSFSVYLRKFVISCSCNTWPQSCNTKFILHAKMPYFSMGIFLWRSTKLISWLNRGKKSAFRLHILINTDRAVRWSLLLRCCTFDNEIGSERIDMKWENHEIM